MASKTKNTRGVDIVGFLGAGAEKVNFSAKVGQGDLLEGLEIFISTHDWQRQKVATWLDKRFDPTAQRMVNGITLTATLPFAWFERRTSQRTGLEYWQVDLKVEGRWAQMLSTLKDDVKGVMTPADKAATDAFEARLQRRTTTVNTTVVDDDPM